MDELVVAGGISGLLLGGVLRYGDLCFHSMFRGLLERRAQLAAMWALGVTLAAVGLSAVYAWGDWDQLNQGLPFDPVGNVLGSLLIGVGMVVALSCASGLFYKLGAGMVGALVGLGGWMVGELVVRDVELPGPDVYERGEDATLPGILGLPRIVMALALLGAVILVLRSTGRFWGRASNAGNGYALPGASPEAAGSASAQWRWPAAGVALGLVVTGAWALAGWSGASFGPSTVGAASALADRLSGDPFADQDQWLLAFLVGVILGSAAWSLVRGRFWIRGEDLPRYLGLLVGGALLGAGGSIAGGCNLGHGLSGTAQMSVSSYTAVASMAVGVWLTTYAKRHLLPHARSTPSSLRTDWRANADQPA